MGPPRLVDVCDMAIENDFVPVLLDDFLHWATPSTGTKKLDIDADKRLNDTELPALLEDSLHWTRPSTGGKMTDIDTSTEDPHAQIDTSQNGQVVFVDSETLRQQYEQDEQDELDELREEFEFFDTDQSGLIDLSELKDAMKELQRSGYGTNDSIFAVLDSCKKDFLDFDDFVSLMTGVDLDRGRG
mmetsp:Transcript_46187/g.100358  ORF Transcript_46187/g.100358 Transcript_46187/m.100358 type:complete len:186 (-) Transcript_46187:81-638(-)